jgi:hypothetical protein
MNAVRMKRTQKGVTLIEVLIVSNYYKLNPCNVGCAMRTIPN